MGNLPSRVKDLTGRRFGRLVVTDFVETRRYKTGALARWLCRCDCGTDTVVFANSLTSGRQVSCGCHKREYLIRTKTTHGLSRSPEYGIWITMLGRCRNHKDDGYKDYGGRGIQVKYACFEEFIADVGRRPTPDMSIDRIDVNGHYEAGNCRWATAIEQANNTTRNRIVDGKSVAQWARDVDASYGTIHGRIQSGWDETRAVSEPVRKKQRRFATIDGKTHCVAEWARITGISEWTIYMRIRRGWSPERAITQPLRRQ